MSDNADAKLDLTLARRELAHLYEQVTQGKQRIEIADGDSRDTCVIISRQELESLERALEILSDTDGVRELSAALAQAAAAAERPLARV